MYLCLHLPSGRLYNSRHVQFIENQFPYTTHAAQSTREADVQTPTYAPPTIVPISPSPLVQSLVSATLCPDPHQQPVLSSPSHSVSAIPTAEQNTGNNLTGSLIDYAQVPGESSNPEPTNSNSPEPETHPATLANNPTPEPETSSSSPTPPPQPVANTHPMQTRAKNKITKPTQKLTLMDTPEPKPTIPTTVAQAMRDPNWRGSMTDEYNSQISNHTFELVPPEPHQNVIATKWIHTVKYMPDGTIRRYKSRWMACGYKQEYGVDYAETFSPVVKTLTIHLVLQLAVSRSWVIKQLDVNNAFLQGTLTDQVYVTQPPGFVDPDRSHHVCRLRIALYGLKQAPRAWYQELRNFLLQMGCINSVADTSVFVYIHGAHLIYILVYVDNIIFTGSSSSLVTSCIHVLAARFSLKEPTDLSYFLGVEATRTNAGLHLMQRKYIIDLLTKTKMLDAKPVATPMAVSPKLTLGSGKLIDDPREFRMLVGILQYLSFTRPDIAYCVNRLSQFMHRPTEDHWQAAKWVLRYLAGTLSHGILLRRDTPFTLHAYFDADWAGDTDNFVSTNAFIVYIGATPIAWSSKKQLGVARSSTEAKYRAVANTAAELRWVCSLLSEFGIALTQQPVVFYDNVGATYLSANPVFHSRMKHLALDFHFVRENVRSGALRVTHVSTKDQLADALTKPLPRPHFPELVHKIEVVSLPPS